MNNDHDNLKTYVIGFCYVASPYFLTNSSSVKPGGGLCFI